jgi:pyruvate dehydrogenase E1 component alpha subunit
LYSGQFLKDDETVEPPISYLHSFKGLERRSSELLQGKDPEFLRGLLYSMIRIRAVELEIERRYHEDEMKTPVHLVIGQEATSVGLCSALNRADRLYCSHRTHGGYLAKGGDLKAMMSELYCRANGCSGSRGGSMHLVDPKVGMAGSSAIVAGILPIAAGSAFASKISGDSRVSAVLFGEAATEEGACAETLNFAALKKLPLVFFCENNFYSVCTPLSQRQPPISLHERAAAFGMNAVLVDGTSVLEVHEATSQAVERARRGQGPTFIEAQVYRWRAHAGAGDDSASGYRAVAEREAWEREHCPIERFDSLLTKHGHVDQTRRREMESRIAREVKEAFEHARLSPLPDVAGLAQHVYASPARGG